MKAFLIVIATLSFMWAGGVIPVPPAVPVPVEVPKPCTDCGA